MGKAGVRSRRFQTATDPRDTIVRILFIGGAKMTGPFAVRALLDEGHEVSLLHRSNSEWPLLHGATQIIADKSDLPAMRDRLAAMRIDVIVHMIAYTAADATTFMEAAVGIIPRAVVISSMDVYRAYGRLTRTETGPPDPTPLTEDSPLRASPSIRGSAYDKIAVERICRSDARLPCTILRYPAVFGVGDPHHRLHAWIRRMDDHRPYILIGQSQFNWHFTHAYVENVAAALSLAITNPAATDRVYNVADSITPTWPDWIRQVGRGCNWSGQVLILRDDQLPPHLSDDSDFSQDWTVDITRIRADLGYVEPIDARKAMDRAIQWERANAPARDPEKFDYAAEDAAARASAANPQVST
jgi:nucleoside-diphosphate-sugar epimerase